MSLTSELTPRVERLRSPGYASAFFRLSDRDCQIMDFLWRWKLAPSATLHAVAGQGRTPGATYQALMRLSRLGYLESQTEERFRFHFWTLSKKGYKTIHESLGELKEEGFRSEFPWHDLSVLAFQLGEWAEIKSSRVEFFTEQEMRRKSVDDYPDWVPQCSDHRSDGYTRITPQVGRPRVLAYEVELTEKSIARYETLIRVYRMIRETSHVYWLVGSDRVQAQILKAITRARDEQDHYHLFVDFDAYQRDGWDAPVKSARSETLFTIRKNLQGLCGEEPSIFLRSSQSKAWGMIHYDPRKALEKKAD